MKLVDGVPRHVALRLREPIVSGASENVIVIDAISIQSFNTYSSKGLPVLHPASVNSRVELRSRSRVRRDACAVKPLARFENSHLSKRGWDGRGVSGLAAVAAMPSGIAGKDRFRDWGR